MKRAIQVLIAASALCFACAAWARHVPPPSQAQPSKPKARKVWTNEDIAALREQSNFYQEENRKQQAPPPKAEPAKPKARKVWNNEDVSNLRQPSDAYEEEKRKKAEEEAAKAASEKAASQTAAEKKDEKPDFLPKTLEEAEKRGAAKQYEIAQQYEAIDLVKKELAEAKTDEARAAIQKKIDGLTATLEEAVAELHAIDARTEQLKSKAAPAKPAAPKP